MGVLEIGHLTIVWKIWKDFKKNEYNEFWLDELRVPSFENREIPITVTERNEAINSNNLRLPSFQMAFLIRLENILSKNF